MNPNFKKCVVWLMPLVVWVLLLVVGKYYREYVSTRVMPCWFNLLTGYLCPGCGGTRSFYALLQGDVLSSVEYNAFVPSMAVVGAVLYVRAFLKVVCGRDINVLPKNDKWVYVLLVGWLLYAILRNVRY